MDGNAWGNNVADANADYDKWLRVLETMASWDVKIVVPGHGDPGTAIASKKRNNTVIFVF